MWTVDACSADEDPDWDAFVAGHPRASVYHHYRWRRMLIQACRCETHYLVAKGPSGEVGGVLPLARLRSLLFGDFLVSLPYFNYGGPLVSCPEADAALLHHAVGLARKLGVSHMELRETQPRSDEWPVRIDKVAMMLRLEADADLQFRRFGSKLRAQIRRPQREGASARRGHTELLADFYKVFSRNMRDLGTPVYGFGFFGQVLETLGSAAELVVVYVGREPAAAGLIVHHRGRTEIPWASSLREWNRIGVNMLLYWEVLRVAIERGSHYFDFGRSTVDAGTYRFKAQWGALPQPLFWHYWLRAGVGIPKLNPSNARFSNVIRLWQRLPIWAANSLGPLIIRRLP